jgi:hypothetical protein
LKLLIKTTVVLLILLGIVYVSANFVLKKVAVRVVEELKPKLEKKGILIENFDYSGVRLNSYNSIAITQIDLDFYLNKTMYGKESFHAHFDTRSITMRFADFSNPSLFFTLKDFSVFIEPDEESEKKPFGKLENGYLTSRIPVYIKNPEESAREILDEIKILFQENKTHLDLEIKVDVLLGVDDKELKVGMFTERVAEQTYLKFDADEIIAAARSFDLELAEKEAEIIADYPSKVPAMIKITRDAKGLSTAEKGKDTSFPEDAYRHIYWSYHLTKAFGPDLAKEITDAHETAPGNTKKEHLMDYHNNAVGRGFANEHLNPEEIKQRVLQSKDIVRNPQEVR